MVPGALLHNLKHNKVLHERVVIATVVVEDTPLVAANKRIEVEKLGKGFYSVRVHHGFFRNPRRAPGDGRSPPLRLALDVPTATFFIGRETLIPAEHSELSGWRSCSIAIWPAAPCRRRASIICRRTEWSNSAPQIAI